MLKICCFPLPSLTIRLVLTSLFLVTAGMFSSASFGYGNMASSNIQQEDEVLIHHWNFNEIANDSNFTIASPELLHVTSRAYGAYLQYDGARWDRVNEPTNINARENPYIGDDDRALRLRNPAGDFYLALPTTGYRNVVFRYAVTRTSSGATAHTVAYSVDGGENFTDDGLSESLVSVSEDHYNLVQFDFTGLEGVDDNSDFMIRISMTGEGSEPENTDGNQRFNNITLDGERIEDDMDRILVHHWKFDDIPNPDDPDGGCFSFPRGLAIGVGGILGGYTTIDGEEDARASLRYDGLDDCHGWDRVNDPTPINARTEPYEEEDDRALRLRNPASPFTLQLPTTYYTDIVFRYAVKRTSNGAQEQQIAYTLDGETFTSEGVAHESYRVGEGFVLHELDFSGMEEVNENPDFAIRITGTGPGSEPENMDGNQRYNHITLEGKPTYTSAEPGPSEVPDAVRLEQNYPNPFNPSTQIRFTLPEQQHVTLEVFDITGRHVQTLIDRTMSRGEHLATFEPGNNLSSGIYLYRLQAGDQVFTRRMTFLK